MDAKPVAARGLSGICVLALALLLASCAKPTYTVGGMVSGLTGTGLVLQNNGGNDLAVSANGYFTFSSSLAKRKKYSVTVRTQPSGETCTVANGSGTISGNVTNVAVNCVGPTSYTIGGTVSGLTGTGLMLQNNGGNDLAISGGGTFTFSVALANGAIYNVAVLTPPSGQGCAVANGSGSVAGANVTNVAVTCAAAPAAPAPSLGFGVKELQFTWPAVSGATFYRLQENPDGVSGYTQVATNITALGYNHTIPVHRRLNASYIVDACNIGGCTGSAPLAPGTNLTQAIGYVKASNTGAGDNFGFSVAVSGDGNTLAVGASQEDSAATGIGGNQTDDCGVGSPMNCARDSGAVYVYSRNTTTGVWSQQAYVKASNAGAGDQFGYSIALSGDGNTLAVGAYGEASSTTGINSMPNESALLAGAVYVYIRTAGTWSQQAYVKASNTESGDSFGSSVALSGDGNTLAVGAPFEGSPATGIDGNQTDDCNAMSPMNCAMASGAVYVYTRTGSTWSQQAYVKASNTGAADLFGNSVALNGDGSTLAAGAPLEDSSSIGIGSAQNNESATDAGAVYVYTRSAGTWSQQAYVKASNTGAGDNFGTSLALSGDGNTLAVGAPLEDGSGTGIGSMPDDSAGDAGAAYVYTRSAGTWSQQAYVKSFNTGITKVGDNFGTSVALSSDGNTLAVGAPLEDSGGTGIDSAADELATDAGAVYFYTRSAGIWSQKAYVKASNLNPSNTGAVDNFGNSVALSSDGNTLAVGADLEDSSTTGISSTPNDGVPNSGAVYLY